MCETMKSSHRRRPTMPLVRALLAPTASGDGAGERFCTPLPPSSHFSTRVSPKKKLDFNGKKKKTPYIGLRSTEYIDGFFFFFPLGYGVQKIPNGPGRLAKTWISQKKILIWPDGP